MSCIFSRVLTILIVVSLFVTTVGVVLAQAPEEGDVTGAAQTEVFKGFDPTTCYIPKEGVTTKIKAPVAGKQPPYRIALSNSYIGNDWRTEMIQAAKAFANLEDVKPLVSEFYVVSSGMDANAQIAMIDLMVASKYDAILLSAASTTALNPAIKRAHDAGIVVVSFDNTDTSPYSVKVNHDQFEFGAKMAQWLVDELGGKGDVFMITGVAGTEVDNGRTGGAKDVFAKYPDIKILGEQPGMWANGPAQAAMATALGAFPKIDGVWCQGGDFGVLKAFQDANRPFVPVGGEAENGFRRLAAELKIPVTSVGQSPSLSAVAFKVALDMLKDGAEMPEYIYIPPPTATYPDIVDGRDYFSELPDTFFSAIQIPQCNIKFNAEQILSQDPY